MTNLKNELGHDTIMEIKKYLLDINMDGLNKPWCEGYIAAFVSTGLITNGEQDILIDWMNNIYK